MKIKIKDMAYEKALAHPVGIHQSPVRPLWVFRFLLKMLSTSDLKATNFTHREIGMERLGKDDPSILSAPRTASWAKTG